MKIGVWKKEFVSDCFFVVMIVMLLWDVCYVLYSLVRLDDMRLGFIFG